MGYAFLGAEDPCASLSFFERWFTPACKIAETRAAEEGWRPESSGSCEDMKWWQIWRVPGCIGEVASAASGEGEAPAVSNGMVGGTTTVGGHAYPCSGNPGFPAFRCTTWPAGQGLSNAHGVPLVITVGTEERVLSPGSGTYMTPSNRDEAAANAMDARSKKIPTEAIVAIVVGSAAVLGAGVYFATAKRKRRR